MNLRNTLLAAIAALVLGAAAPLPATETAAEEAQRMIDQILAKYSEASDATTFAEDAVAWAILSRSSDVRTRFTQAECLAFITRCAAPAISTIAHEVPAAQAAWFMSQYLPRAVRNNIRAWVRDDTAKEWQECASFEHGSHEWHGCLLAAGKRDNALRSAEIEKLKQ